jgi:endonuclease/exonuclease/phosphatase family metal-dependent hydrolase
MRNPFDLLRKRTRGQNILLGCLAVATFIFGWFSVVRLISPWTVVKTIHLESDNAATLNTPLPILRVGCYNIAHGRGGRYGATNWEGGSKAEKIERLKQIAKLLKDTQLDIVVLNEVDFSSIWSGHVDQARVIAEEADYPYIVEQRNLNMAIPFVSIRFGNAILSKYPVSDTTFLDYPNPSEFIELFSGGYKEGVAAVVDLPDGSQIQVVAVHLCVSSERIRIASARMMLELQQQSAIPTIALGDFNTAARGYPGFHEDADSNNAIDLLAASPQFSTLPQGLPLDPKHLTFPSEKPDRVIDWIFVPPPWQIQNKEVLASNLSDHLPVVAELSWVHNP